MSTDICNSIGHKIVVVFYFFILLPGMSERNGFCVASLAKKFVVQTGTVLSVKVTLFLVTLGRQA